jgi:hypothetical protein
MGWVPLPPAPSPDFYGSLWASKATFIYGVMAALLAVAMFVFLVKAEVRK